MYRKGREMRAGMKDHFDQKLNAGVIEAANREWTIPVFFYPKKDGKLRL